MTLPKEPVTITVDQIDQLNRQLSTMRHDINNQLSLVVAAVELIRLKPHLASQMMTTLNEQPPKITASVAKFTGEFERAFGITRQ